MYTSVHSSRTKVKVLLTHMHIMLLSNKWYISNGYRYHDGTVTVSCLRYDHKNFQNIEHTYIAAGGNGRLYSRNHQGVWVPLERVCRSNLWSTHSFEHFRSAVDLMVSSTKLALPNKFGLQCNIAPRTILYICLYWDSLSNAEAWAIQLDSKCNGGGGTMEVVNSLLTLLVYKLVSTVGHSLCQQFQQMGFQLRAVGSSPVVGRLVAEWWRQRDRGAQRRSFSAKRGKKKIAFIFSYQDGLSWHFHTLKTRKRCFETIRSLALSTVALWLPTSLTGAAEFVNIGRNVVVASKSEGWCALSPIASTGSRDEYITITQEYKGRRELTQSSCPKVTRGWGLLHVQTRSHAHTSIHRKVLVKRGTRGQTMNSCYNDKNSTKSGAAGAAPAAPLLTALQLMLQYLSWMNSGQP